MLSRYLLPLFLLAACASPPDRRLVLRQLAEACTGAVYTDLWAAVEAEGVALDSAAQPSMVADGAFDMALPSGGAIQTGWWVQATEDPQVDGQRSWEWLLDVEILRRALPSADIMASGAWRISETRYDIRIAEHAWEGTLALEGDTLSVSFEALFSGNLHWVEGALGETEVSWENPSPDLP